jgi:carboxyl-terminal processing protease
MQKDRNGVFGAFPDSTRKEFRTATGRPVYEHGGVMPDSVVAESDPGPMVRQLHRKSLFFRFVTTYMASHRNEEITGVTPAVLDAFRRYLDEQKFEYTEESEARIRDLREMAEKLHYSDAVKADLDRLQQDMDAEKRRGFERYRDHIEYELGMELMGRVRGEQGRIQASFREDPVLTTGVSLLKDRVVYTRLVGG